MPTPWALNERSPLALRWRAAWDYFGSKCCTNVSLRVHGAGRSAFMWTRGCGILKVCNCNSRWTQALCNLDRSHKHAIVSMTVEQRESTSPIRFLASRKILLDLNGGILSWPAAGHRSATRSFNDWSSVKIPDNRTYCRGSGESSWVLCDFFLYVFTPAIDS